MRIFVYGTLKSTSWNRWCMRRARGVLLTEAITLLRFPLIANPVPKMLPFPGQGNNVEGEIYNVPERGVHGYLDALEGHPNWYTRTPITVLVQGRPIEVQAYILNSHSVPFNWESFKFLSKF